MEKYEKIPENTIIYIYIYIYIYIECDKGNFEIAIGSTRK